MNLEVERLDETMRTSLVNAGDVPPVFIADSGESGEHCIVVSGREATKRFILLLFGPLSWTDVSGEMQVLSADMLFEVRLCTKSTTASTTTIPRGITLRTSNVGFSADELFLLPMNTSLVNDEIALLGEATTAVRIIADVVATVFDVTVLDLQMRFEIAVRDANMTTLRAGRWMDSLDVLLHLDICREANSNDKGMLVQAWVDIGHFGGANFTPEAIAAVLAVLVSDQVGRSLEASIAR